MSRDDVFATILGRIAVILWYFVVISTPTIEYYKFGNKYFEECKKLSSILYMSMKTIDLYTTFVAFRYLLGIG